MLTVGLLARISSTAHHASPGIVTAAILVAFVLVAAARSRLRSRRFGMRIGRNRIARLMLRSRGFGTHVGGGGGEGVNPFNQSEGTVNQIDRTL